MKLSTMLLSVLVSPLALAVTYDLYPDRGESIARTLEQALAGDTIVLHGGRYYEQLSCSLAGRAEAPIEIRGAEGETAVLDGGFPEFYREPAAAWVPEAAGLYRSARRYGNIEDVAGAFADQPVGLLTYWLRSDLTADSELAGADPDQKVMNRPVYGGPGLWLDRESGYLFARLSHTSLGNPLAPDYRGETDPRRVRLAIAPISAVPLHLTGARHLTIRNLTIAGGGRDTVVIDGCDYLTLDRVTILAGSLRGQTSGHVRLLNCTIAGRTPPWSWRTDSSTGCASGTIRDIARAITPILLDTSHAWRLEPMPRIRLLDRTGNRPPGHGAVAPGSTDAEMPQMVSPPHNHHWEIAWSEIRDGHDGVFLAGRDMHMHHCAIDNMQDDAVDFSSPVTGLTDGVRFEYNLIRRCVTSLSTHNQGSGQGLAILANNVIDLREPMAWSRPSVTHPAGSSHPGNGFFMHGGDHADDVESYEIAANTFVGRVFSRYFYAFGTLNHLKPGATRAVHDNTFVYLDAYPMPFVSKSLEGMSLQAWGNRHWSVVDEAGAKPGFLAAWQQHAYSHAAREQSGRGWEEGSSVAPPAFLAFSADPSAVNDYRTAADEQPLRVGVDGRLTAGHPR